MLDNIKGRFPIDDIRADRNRDGVGMRRADWVAVAGTGRHGGGGETARQGFPAMAVKTCSRRHMAGWRTVGGGVGTEEGVGAGGLD
jgi:hypothetical protein